MKFISPISHYGNSSVPPLTGAAAAKAEQQHIHEMPTSGSPDPAWCYCGELSISSGLHQETRGRARL